MAGSAYVPSDSNSRVRNWMDQIEERLSVMETQQRLFNTSVKGGAIQVLRDEDAKLATNIGVGTYGQADGATRTAETLAFLDAGNNNVSFHLLLDEEHGWVTPKLPLNFVQDTFISTTAADYANIYKTHLVTTGMVIVVQYLVTCDSGTTGKTRLSLNGQPSDEITINPTEQKLCKFSWNITGKYGFGNNLPLRIQAYRVSGAGNVNVYAPDAAYMSALNMRTDATTGGIASGS